MLLKRIPITACGAACRNGNDGDFTRRTGGPNAKHEGPHSVANHKVDSNRWQAYLLAIKDGNSRRAAAKISGISLSTVNRMLQGNLDTPEYRNAKAIFDELHPKDVVLHDGLSKEARRALNDFAYFRLRYFGRYSTKWQVDAAEQIVLLLESEDKEYLVQNVAPGTGKSTLWHDIICWLICRNRAIRIMVGSASERVARAYGARVLRSLERTEPLKNDSKMVERGLVADAVATLIDDFGRFKPAKRDLWRKEEFVVEQSGGNTADDKEATLSTYGRDGTFLGGRFDFVLWDDLVTSKIMRTADAKENTETWWDSEAESRLEPGGLMVLQGQRLGAEDLYRYCLDKPGGYKDDDDGEPIIDPDSRMYRHIVYKTHYEEKCRGLHKRSDPAYDPKDPDGSGCLIDPRRIPWTECARRMANAAERWLVVYQQQDTDPASVLVQKIWVNGGRDPETGIDYIGCWDHTRSAGILPTGLTKPWILVVSVDPSPTKFWACTIWLYHHQTKQRILIDLFRGTMTAPQFIGQDPHTREFTGLLEDWWQSYKRQGHAFSDLILEENSAKFLLQQQHFRDWAAQRGVLITAHVTSSNKNDPRFGVTMLGPEYMHGRVRLPGNKNDASRGRSMCLVSEVTRYEPTGKTNSMTTDALMSHWFLEHTLQKSLIARITRPADLPKSRVPSWLSGRG